MFAIAGLSPYLFFSIADISIQSKRPVFYSSVFLPSHRENQMHAKRHIKAVPMQQKAMPTFSPYPTGATPPYSKTFRKRSPHAQGIRTQIPSPRPVISKQDNMLSTIPIPIETALLNRRLKKRWNM
jgi:hypothetical protein